MITVIAQGVTQGYFRNLIDDLIELDSKDKIQWIGSIEMIDIELYDSESNQTYKGAKALSLIIDEKRARLKDEQCPCGCESIETKCDNE